MSRTFAKPIYVRTKRPRILSLATLFCLPLLAAACAEHLDRREALASHSGDAVAAAKALQIIDPWDRRAARTRLPQDGVRAAAAIDTYRAGPSEDGDTAQTGTTTQ